LTYRSITCLRALGRQPKFLGESMGLNCLNRKSGKTLASRQLCMDDRSRRMGRIGLVLVGLTLAVGCATPGNYRILMDRAVGESEERLVGSWGVPANSYSTGDHKFLVYNRWNQVGLQAGACQTTFKLINRGDHYEVESASWGGVGCIAADQ
jgi:hypothetical protein